MTAIYHLSGELKRPDLKDVVSQRRHVFLKDIIWIKCRCTMEDLVSVIMPSYNTGKFIKESIESVQSQTYQNWELIIVDDCSTDNTKELVAQFAEKDSRIKYECNPQNSGAAITRNNALRRAKGKWIAFLDSDDLWMPDKLEKQIKFMVKNDYYFSYTNYCEINEQSAETGTLITGPKHITKVGMYAFCWPGCLTVMYNREKIGLIQIADIKKNNDYAMWLKVCKKADCYLLDENLAKYRRGRAGSISTHGYATLIKWHYKLFREAEDMDPISSFIITCINMVCGFYKKKRYVKQYNISCS
jgi:glycosyltransferase involved in cell wall biosynthesis